MINRPTDNPQASPTTAEDRWTVQRLLNWTTDYFAENGSDQARLDAEVLLAEALQCQRIDLYTRFDEEPSEAERGVFRDWVARHAEGEPVAYLVGYREFFSLKFLVNASVLIPRPETEHLVNEALDAIRDLEKIADPVRIVDVGTGSGNVAIAIRRHARDARIAACDLSQTALAVAMENAKQHGVDDSISFVVSDLLNDFPESERFELIVSNPPYIGLSEKPDLDRSVVDFEPHEALFADGATGTETIAKLVEQASVRLVPGGLLMFEISPLIADACRRIIEATGGLQYLKTVNDLAGLQRVVVARRVGI